MLTVNPLARVVHCVLEGKVAGVAKRRDGPRREPRAARDLRAREKFRARLRDAMVVVAAAAGGRDGWLDGCDAMR